MKRLAALLMPAFAMFLMGQTAATSCNRNTEPQQVWTSHTRWLRFPPSPSNWAATLDVPDGEAIGGTCSGPQKILCEWEFDPNAPQPFENYGPQTDARAEVENIWSRYVPANTVQCAMATTPALICEQWAPLVDAPFEDPSAMTSFDVGECSTAFPTEFFVDMLADQFQKQSDGRLEQSQGPAGEDIALWLDFVVGLKDHSSPVQLWTDYSSSPPDGRTISELIVQSWFRVDGNVSWQLDPDWLGGRPGADTLARGIQTTLYILGAPLGLFSIGNCEKDRDMAVQMRGELVATPDGGFGVRINTNQDCGPNRNGPCTWAAIDPWPARPLCNNRIKPQIESNFVNGIVTGFMSDGVARNLNKRADGQDLLPFPYPVRRVAVTPTQIHFVHLEEANDDYDAWQDMLRRNLCGLDRQVDNQEQALLYGGHAL